MAGMEERPVPAPHFRGKLHSPLTTTQRGGAVAEALLQAVGQGKELTCTWLMHHRHPTGYWYWEPDTVQIRKRSNRRIRAWWGPTQPTRPDTPTA